MNAPDNWSHKSGYSVNADGKSIEYTHDKKPLLAVVEAMVNENEETLEFYTAIFDTSSERPWETVESHEIYLKKDTAKGHLFDLMKKHS